MRRQWWCLALYSNLLFLFFFVARAFVLLEDGNYSNREGTIQEARTLDTVKLSGIDARKWLVFEIYIF